jgi:hypothetical protein
MIDDRVGVKSAVKKFEVISIEPSDLAHFWVVSYKIGDGEIEKEAIEAIDSNEAYIKFRNMMIKQFKNRNKGKRS